MHTAPDVKLICIVSSQQKLARRVVSLDCVVVVLLVKNEIEPLLELAVPVIDRVVDCVSGRLLPVKIWIEERSRARVDRERSAAEVIFSEIITELSLGCRGIAFLDVISR